MKRHLYAILLLLAGASPALEAEADARAIAEQLRQTMGAEAFDAARVLHFTWGVVRDGQQVVAYEHSWDRWTGDYRLSGTDRESGLPWLALFNVNTRQGNVWLGDEAYAGDALSEQFERAYGRFINDSYWLLMPWKWLDPGVELTHLGSEEIAGELCDVVELSFADDVGLTSNDRYRGFVSQDSGRMIRWAYVLETEEGKRGAEEPTVWDWTDWQQVEPGVWFALNKVRQQADGPAVEIFTRPVELVSQPTPAELAGWFEAQR